MAESEWDIRITTDTPYLTLTGKLWGVFCEHLRENWPHYNGTSLYHIVLATEDGIAKGLHCLSNTHRIRVELQWLWIGNEGINLQIECLTTMLLVTICSGYRTFLKVGYLYTDWCTKAGGAIIGTSWWNFHHWPAVDICSAASDKELIQMITSVHQWVLYGVMNWMAFVPCGVKGYYTFLFIERLFDAIFLPSWIMVAACFFSVIA